MGDKSYAWRFYFILFLLLIAIGLLVSRLFYLHIINRPFLLKQSNVRAVRLIDIPASRGMILDRNGVPLAVSTPVDSVWINPQEFEATNSQLSQLANLLNISINDIKKHTNAKKRHWFIYLKRHINPNLADKIRNLNIDGLFLQREYKRFYPEGEVSSQVIGLTDIDDKGQEGLELAYDSWLKGNPGKMRVLNDRLGHIVSIIDDIRKPEDGHDLILSIDRRVQYVAYAELARTVHKYHADAGTVVVLDVKNGEVLAMVNNPSFNPNDRNATHGSKCRNRGVTDTFEPGSTLKTFSVASALESGKYSPNTKVDTNPGRYVVSGKVIIDEGVNHGILTLTQVLQKSSNIGIAKIILSLPAMHLVDLLQRVGFGENTQSGFPGESSGSIADMRGYRPFVLATLSFGYAISVTPLQLANAYAVIAARGIRYPLSFLKLTQPNTGKRVITTKVADEMLVMLKKVVEEGGGTGAKASIPGYEVAGKTGTAYVAGKHGYNKDYHVSSFVGIAPVNDPRYVVAVIIRNPKGQDFGAIVAAPAFAYIMGNTLRLMGVPPQKT